MSTVGDLLGETQGGGEHCCNRAGLLWAEDDLLIATIDRTPLRTDAVDQLPPWRARMIVTVCLRAGAVLEHGDPEMFDRAACAAGRANTHAAGWWRAALGMDPVEVPAAPPRRRYRLPTGWKYGNNR